LFHERNAAQSNVWSLQSRIRELQNEANAEGRSETVRLLGVYQAAFNRVTKSNLEIARLQGSIEVLESQRDTAQQQLDSLSLKMGEKIEARNQGEILRLGAEINTINESIKSAVEGIARQIEEIERIERELGGQSAELAKLRAELTPLMAAFGVMWKADCENINADTTNVNVETPPPGGGRTGGQAGAGQGTGRGNQQRTPTPKSVAEAGTFERTAARTQQPVSKLDKFVQAINNCDLAGARILLLNNPELKDGIVMAQNNETRQAIVEIAQSMSPR